VQEVFQAVTKVFYDDTGTAGPIVLLGERFWTESVPVGAVMAAVLEDSHAGDRSGVVCCTDDVRKAVDVLTRS
jgi:hypothetical protein